MVAAQPEWVQLIKTCWSHQPERRPAQAADAPVPKGDVVATGKRDPDSLTFRGEISGGDGGARITAPLDWYSTYLKGGKFKKALRKGLQMGFKGKK